MWYKLKLSCSYFSQLMLFFFPFHVYSQTKGQSLHSLIHRRGHQFSFQSATKIMSQIAQVRQKNFEISLSVSGYWIKIV